jgi:hypothetical protein
LLNLKPAPDGNNQDINDQEQGWACQVWENTDARHELGKYVQWNVYVPRINRFRPHHPTRFNRLSRRIMVPA